jgi:hypothetical protein
MHKPSEEDKRTFARYVAKDMGVSARQVRKQRASGKITSKPAEMPWATGYGDRERYEPIEGGRSIHGNKCAR